MKSIAIGLIYVFSFMLLFFILSSIGMLWGNTYKACISSGNWFALYGIFIGSWTSMFPAREYYMANEDYFERVF